MEDVFSRFGNIGKMKGDRGKLDGAGVRSFFKRHGVKLRLTTTYNPEANGKGVRGRPPIINALV